MDGKNAFNTLSRHLMLEAVYARPELAPLWRAAALTYAHPSQLLVMSSGSVHSILSSSNGARQGDVFGSLFYSVSLQPIYEESVRGLDVTATAIIDDFDIVGPPTQAFEAYDRYCVRAAALGIVVNTTKTKVQCPRGQPDAATAQLALDHHLEVVVGNHECLGAQVGIDEQAKAEWVSRQLDKHRPLLAAIADPRLPAQVALLVGRLCVVPKANYLIRALPPRATADAMRTFDANVAAAVISRNGLPNPLPDKAKFILSQPIRNGGLGFRRMEITAHAAYWSASVQASDLVDPLVLSSQIASCPSSTNRRPASALSWPPESLPATALAPRQPTRTGACCRKTQPT